MRRHRFRGGGGRERRRRRGWAGRRRPPRGPPPSPVLAAPPLLGEGARGGVGCAGTKVEAGGVGRCERWADGGAGGVGTKVEVGGVGRDDDSCRGVEVAARWWPWTKMGGLH
jgi:hypothetical protein